jgi:hypothetical protein
MPDVTKMVTLFFNEKRDERSISIAGGLAVSWLMSWVVA